MLNLDARCELVANATLKPLYPGKRTGTADRGGWVGLGTGTYYCGKSRPHQYPDPETPGANPIASCYTAYVFLGRILFDLYTSKFSLLKARKIKIGRRVAHWRVMNMRTQLCYIT